MMKNKAYISCSKLQVQLPNRTICSEIIQKLCNNKKNLGLLPCIQLYSQMYFASHLRGGICLFGLEPRLIDGLR